MVWNWPQDQVDAIVVTDGSRILGLGAWVGAVGGRDAPQACLLGCAGGWALETSTHLPCPAPPLPLPLPYLCSWAGDLGANGLGIPVGKLDLYVGGG